MGLRVTSQINAYNSGFTGTSKFAIIVPKAKLSLPYELGFRTIITGIIKRVTFFNDANLSAQITKSLAGQKVDFFLYAPAVGSNDILFILEESWPVLRDHAVLPGDIALVIDLTSAKFGDKKVALYPNLDLIA